MDTTKEDRKMKTNTNRYEASHGKKPRGRGYWFFEITAGEQTKTVCAFGTLTDARSQAIEKLKREMPSARQITEIVVMP